MCFFDHPEAAVSFLLEQQGFGNGQCPKGVTQIRDKIKRRTSRKQPQIAKSIGFCKFCVGSVTTARRVARLTIDRLQWFLYVQYQQKARMFGPLLLSCLLY